METGSSLLNRITKNVNFNTNAYLVKVSTDSKDVPYVPLNICQV